MANCCETEESLKRPDAPDLRSSQAQSTTQEQSRGSRKQRENSIKWSNTKIFPYSIQKKLTKK